MSKQNYKRRLDAYISQERVFTERDKHNIHTRINKLKKHPNNRERKPNFLFAKLAGPVVLVGMLIGTTSLIPYNIFQDNQAKQNVSEQNFEFPSTTDIKAKVNEIKSDFQLGMTQQQVKDAFGEDFIHGQAQNPEGEPIPYWTYNYFKDPSLKKETTPIPGDINIQSLGDKKLGIQFSVHWKDNKVLFGTIAYRGSKDIKVIEFKRNGEVSEFTIDSW